jgi:DNA-binding transcriptional ArsR family regulator
VISIDADKDSATGDRLAALADPTRRHIVEMLGDGPRTATAIHEAFPIANPAVSRHLRVLREAGLVTERRLPEDARVRLYGLEPEPLADLSQWLDGLSRMWQSQLDSYKDYVALRKRGPGE